MVSRYLKSDTINKKEIDHNNSGQGILLRSISIIRRKIMSYKKIQKVKVYDQVANSLIEIIKSGQLQPGDKLESVEQLAKNYDVGRSAIREALSGLRTMGLVEMRQGEGTYVKEFHASKFTLPVTTAFLMKLEDVKELYEVRQILEVGTVGLAAVNHQEEDLQRIEEALLKMKHTGGNKKDAERADFSFHLAIAKASHNQMLISLMRSLSEIMSETIRETRRVLLYSEGTEDGLITAHEDIFEAIKCRDTKKAEKAMLNHLVSVQNQLFKHVD